MISIFFPPSLSPFPLLFLFFFFFIYSLIYAKLLSLSMSRMDNSRASVLDTPELFLSALRKVLHSWDKEIKAEEILRTWIGVAMCQVHGPESKSFLRFAGPSFSSSIKRINQDLLQLQQMKALSWDFTCLPMQSHLLKFPFLYNQQNPNWGSNHSQILCITSQIFIE